MLGAARRKSIQACLQWSRSSKAFSAWPALDEEQVADLDKHAERILSSKSASTSAPNADPEVLHRWREMQAALNSPKVQRRETSESYLPTLDETRRVLKGDKQQGRENAPQSDESAVLDWREALKIAQATLDDNRLHADALTDTFGRQHTYLRISLTERCNLRCLYCMPEEGVPLTPHDNLLTTDEIVFLADLFAEVGISKIRLTGGEPTLKKDIVELTGRLHAIPGVKSIGITSNGIVLHRSLADLKANGLELLNLSLDTLKPERFEQMTRRRGLQRVLSTIDSAINLGYDPVKINVVVMRGVNDDEICNFVEMSRDKPVNVRFIEYMPFDGNVWAERKMVGFREMMHIVTERYPEGLEALQDPKGEVAKNYRVKGFRGSVSFITSMTKAFCGDCNRLRLMADGNLKVCLFGANEVSLRDALRQGATKEELLAIISLAVNRKKAAHAGMHELSQSKNRAMVHIGG